MRVRHCARVPDIYANHAAAVLGSGSCRHPLLRYAPLMPVLRHAGGATVQLRLAARLIAAAFVARQTLAAYVLRRPRCRRLAQALILPLLRRPSYGAATSAVTRPRCQPHASTDYGQSLQRAATIALLACRRCAVGHGRPFPECNPMAQKPNQQNPVHKAWKM